MNHRLCSIVYVLSFILFGYFSAHASLDTDTGVLVGTEQSKRIDYSYPILVQTINDDGKMEPYIDPESFLKQLNEETLNSIRSPGEMFIHANKAREMKKQLKLYEIFTLFY